MHISLIFVALNIINRKAKVLLSDYFFVMKILMQNSFEILGQNSERASQGGVVLVFCREIKGGPNDSVRKPLELIGCMVYQKGSSQFK